MARTTKAQLEAENRRLSADAWWCHLAAASMARGLVPDLHEVVKLDNGETLRVQAFGLGRFDGGCVVLHASLDHDDGTRTGTVTICGAQEWIGRVRESGRLGVAEWRLVDLADAVARKTHERVNADTSSRATD